MDNLANINYSVAMSVYKNDKLDWFRNSIDSLLNQTVKADEIVIAVDGPVSKDINDYLEDLENNLIFKIVRLGKNMGTGMALNAAISNCRNEFIARMDSDDVCKPYRMEKQLKFLIENPDISIVGSNMAEFESTITNIVGYRNLPDTHEKICKYMKMRCPFNHMTVIFKKSEVEKVGGYPDRSFDYNEDSLLWVKMYLHGFKFANLQEVLAYARVGKNMFKRRGGFNYFKNERKLFLFMRKHRVINGLEYFKAISVRFMVQILMPNGMRAWFYKNFARKKYHVVN